MPAVGRLACHGAHLTALLGTAWALIATSAPPEPAVDCFKGVPNPTSLDVALGSAPTPGGDGGSTLGSDGSAPATAGRPSCNGIDGIAPGELLTFALAQDSRPSDNGGACWGYTMQSIGPLPQVSLTGFLGDGPPGGDPFTTYDFTSSTGQFNSATAVACRGPWSLAVRPQTQPASGQSVSPLDASTAEPWVVVRRIQIAQAQFCDGFFTQAGAVDCEDTFAVSAIMVAP